MTFDETVNKALEQALQISPSVVRDDLAYNSIREWDSVGHMALVAELEDTFNIMLETDDIVAMSSVAEIKRILKKYNAHSAAA